MKASLSSLELPFRGYGRVSKVGNRDGVTYISPDEQRRKIREAARMAGVELLDEIYIDEDASGGNFARPYYERAKQELRDHEIGGYVVPHLDRFSRWTDGGLGELREIEQELGGRVYSPRGRHTLDTADEAFITTIELAVATRERAAKAEGLKAAQRRAVVERGVTLVAPYGYKKPKPGHPLELDELDEHGEFTGPALVVRTVFELRLEGWTYGRIADHLNAGKFAPPSSAPRWSGGALRKMIRNERYTGAAIHGEFRKDHAHPAIVDERTWSRVVEAAKGTRFADGDRHLLAGLLRCSGCGRAMKRNPVSAKQGSGAYYVCRTNRLGGVCPAPATVRADEVEELVLAEFERRHLHAFEALPDDSRLVESIELERAATSALERVVTRALELARAGSETTRAIVDREVELAEEELRQASAQRRKIENELAGAELPDELDSRAFRNAPVAERRHWLALVFSAVVARATASWREPVAGRIEILTVRDGARLLRRQAPPRPAELIQLVPRLRWDESVPRIEPV